MLHNKMLWHGKSERETGKRGEQQYIVACKLYELAMVRLVVSCVFLKSTLANKSSLFFVSSRETFGIRSSPINVPINHLPSCKKALVVLIFNSKTKAELSGYYLIMYVNSPGGIASISRQSRAD